MLMHYTTPRERLPLKAETRSCGQRKSKSGKCKKSCPPKTALFELCRTDYANATKQNIKQHVMFAWFSRSIWSGAIGEVALCAPYALVVASFFLELVVEAPH